MERIGTELARRDRDGTGEWNGLALNWDDQDRDGTVCKSVQSDLRRYMRPDGRTNIKKVKGTFRDYANAHKRSIKETVRENVNANHLLEFREGPVVFRRGFARSTHSPHFAMLPRPQRLPKRSWN